MGGVGRYVSMNSTHVVVGHERKSGAGGGVQLDTVAFGLTSSDDAVAQLADSTLYTQPDPPQTVRRPHVHVLLVALAVLTRRVASGRLSV